MNDGRRARDKHSIPDLAPPASGPKRAMSTAGMVAVKSSAPSPPPDDGANALFGAGAFDDDAAFGEGLPIGLADGVELGSHPRAALPARTPQDDRRWPTGKSPDFASIELDPAEVSLAANYGASPANVALSVVYFVRVFGRRRALRAEVRALNHALVAAESERDLVLAVLVNERRDALAASAEGQRLLEPLTRIESLAGERRTALSGVNAEYDRRAAELASEENALATAHDANTAQITGARTTAAERAHLCERAEAKKKRFYIEIRAVLDAVEKSGGHASPEQSAQLAAREADVAKQKPELEAAQNEAAEANAAVAALEAAGKDIARRWRDVERRKGVLAAEFQKNVGSHSRGVNEAESHGLQAAVEAAQAILLARGRLIDLPGATLDAIDRADAKVNAAARELERHVRALDAYDSAAYRNGLVVAAGIALSLVLVVIVLVAR